MLVNLLEQQHGTELTVYAEKRHDERRNENGTPEDSGHGSGGKRGINHGIGLKPAVAQKKKHYPENRT